MSQRKRKRTRHSSHHFTDNSDVKTLHVGVMISMFPNYITSSHLQQHFSEFKDDNIIEKAMIIRDFETKESKGYGFTSHEAAENATKLRGKFDKRSGSLMSDCVPRDSCVPRNSCELFFRAMKSKLPNYIKNGQIREHFTEFETDIVSVVVVCDRETKQSKGFGFIKFTSHQVAMDAQKKLHGSMLQGKFQLHISIRKPSASSTSESASVADNDSSKSELTDAFSESKSEEPEIDDQCTLYVGVWNSKFPNFVNNKHLETHFSDFSEHITSARIIRDRSTHETKGYGFVSFTSATEAEKAMKELRSTKLLGRFSLYISNQKSTLHRSGSSVSADITNLKAEKPLDTQMPYSKTFQLRPEAVSLKRLQAAFKAIGSQNHTRVVKQAGQAIVIHGYSLENVENSWKGVKDFVEHSLTITKSTQVSCGCAKVLQHSVPAVRSSTQKSSSSSPSLSLQWQWRDDRRKYTSYPPDVSAKLTKTKHSNPGGKCFFKVNGKNYVVDLSTMKQKNLSTGFTCDVQCLSNSTSIDEQIRFTTTVPMPKAASNQLQQKLHMIIRKHPVDYRIKEDSTVKGSSPHKPCRVLEIEGSEHDVRKAVTEVQAEIIHFHSESPSVAGAAIKYPQEWVHQTKTTDVFELPRNSDERRQIASKLRETLPNARITSIKRIQNKWLWEKYEQSRRRMYDKNAGRVNEKQLFHGSRKTSAERIYHSEEGFDMRFSSQGLWGQANYFAADAQYSDAYAYVKTDGNKELLLARVLTGDSYTSQSDQTLRMPPEKPIISHSDSKVQLKQLRYDTVNGVTNDTKVFMTYSNDKAYPAYLIVYSTSSTASRSSGSARRLPPMAQPGVGTMVAARAITLTRKK